MNRERVKSLAGLIYLMPDKKLRTPGSKYQKKIREIQAIITELHEDPSQDAFDKLLAVKLLECHGNSEYEAHCRYLQYCIPQLIQTSER